jgi:tRNA (guanine-N7-)-methyltransferase
MTEPADTIREHRTIRSFVRRAGRLTPPQQKALVDLWPRFGIEFNDQHLDFADLFRTNEKICLEIGFGNGNTLVQQAQENPQQNYIGIEVHEPGVGHCLIAAQKANINNLRLIIHDAIDVLQQQLPLSSLNRINLYFPDPWPKKRHHKRRIVQPAFLELCADRLKPGGTLHVATDWANYAEHIDAELGSSERFSVSERREHDGDQPLDRPRTKFERRGLRKGHRIWDWRFERLDQ